MEWSLAWFRPTENVVAIVENELYKILQIPKFFYLVCTDGKRFIYTYLRVLFRRKYFVWTFRIAVSGPR
jgi:hypothetical protein